MKITVPSMYFRGVNLRVSRHLEGYLSLKPRREPVCIGKLKSQKNKSEKKKTWSDPVRIYRVDTA